MIIYNKPIDDLSKELLKLMKKPDFEGLTIREIQEKTGIDHPQKIYNRLDKLIKDGYITEDYEILKLPEENKIFLPFFGWAQCGNDGVKVFEEYPRERIEIDLNENDLINKNYKNYFLTRAKGKSMEPKIKTGTNLLIEKFDGNIIKGQLYLLKHNEKAKIKEIVKKGKGYILHSLNPGYPDIQIKNTDEFDIIGVVKEIGIEI